MRCEDGHEWREVEAMNDICHKTENAKTFILLTDSMMGKHGAVAAEYSYSDSSPNVVTYVG
jgi:hypothetical protein